MVLGLPFAGASAPLLGGVFLFPVSYPQIRRSYYLFLYYLSYYLYGG